MSLAILAMVSIVAATGMDLPSLLGWLLFLVPAGLVIGLTVLILIPLGRLLGGETARRPGESTAENLIRSVVVAGCLAILAPIAFAIICFAVCAATVAVVGS
jgi:hypothetical protein